jgi:hypothetical protein
MIEWVSKLTRQVVKFVVRVEEQALAPVEVHYYSLPSVFWRHAHQSKLLIESLATTELWFWLELDLMFASDIQSNMCAYDG